MSDEHTRIERILTECNKLSDVLNSHFLTEFARLHNIDPKHSRFQLKQEIIARWGYFLTVKKKYCLHVTNEEGVPVDKMESKGLITRRSDYPKFAKNRINELLNMLVMHESQDFAAIRKFIKSTEIEIRQLVREHSKTIARPVSFSHALSDYKKIPSHVLGMLLWNEFEYDHFTHGVKGYLFKIKAINFMGENTPGRINSRQRDNIHGYIVLPYEEERLPDYYIVDEDFMVDFCWNDRVAELLKGPLGSELLGNTASLESYLGVSFG